MSGNNECSNMCIMSLMCLVDMNSSCLDSHVIWIKDVLMMLSLKCPHHLFEKIFEETECKAVRGFHEQHRSLNFSSSDSTTKDGALRTIHPGSYCRVGMGLSGKIATSSMVWGRRQGWSSGGGHQEYAIQYVRLCHHI